MSLYLRDPVIGRLVNMIMYDGKKHVAEKIVDKSMWILKRDHRVEDPLNYVKTAIENAKPLVDLRKFRLGGKSIRVPSPCRPERQQSLALRFIRDAFRERGGSTSAEKLAAELVDLVGKTGKARMRREEMHKIAEVNKGYAHFVKWS